VKAKAFSSVSPDGVLAVFSSVMPPFSIYEVPLSESFFSSFSSETRSTPRPSEDVRLYHPFRKLFGPKPFPHGSGIAVEALASLYASDAFFPSWPGRCAFSRRFPFLYLIIGNDTPPEKLRSSWSWGLPFSSPIFVGLSKRLVVIFPFDFVLIPAGLVFPLLAVIGLVVCVVSTSFQTR